MNDRELIARAIHAHTYPRDDWDTELSVVRDLSELMADAMLDAIGDRLLPVLPEWVYSTEVTLFADEYSGECVNGQGLTIAAAIRNAQEAER